MLMKVSLTHSHPVRLAVLRSFKSSLTALLPIQYLIPCKVFSLPCFSSLLISSSLPHHPSCFLLGNSVGRKKRLWPVTKIVPIVVGSPQSMLSALSCHQCSQIELHVKRQTVFRLWRGSQDGARAAVVSIG